MPSPNRFSIPIMLDAVIHSLVGGALPSRCGMRARSGADSSSTCVGQSAADRIRDLLADLTTRYLVLEFVPQERSDVLPPDLLPHGVIRRLEPAELYRGVR